MIELMRRRAKEYAERSEAIVRIRLRRWLRSELHARGESLPEGNYLGVTTEELVSDIQKYGGDVDSLISKFREESIARIAKDELGGNYGKDD